MIGSAHHVWALSAQEEDFYSYTFYVNGVVESTASVQEGEAISIPSPANHGDLKFVGWSESEIIEPTNSKPALVTPPTTMGTRDLTYYAVFATASIGRIYTESLTTDEVSAYNKDIGNKAQSYGDDERVYKEGNVIWSARCQTVNNGEYFQIRKNNVLSYIKIVAPSKIRQVDFIVKDSSINPYNGTVYLVTEPDATSSAHSVGKDNSFESSKASIVPEGNHSTLYIQASTTCQVRNITVTYGEDITYSSYCTNFTTISLNAACHDSDGKVYGTYSNASAWVVPENLTVAEVGVTDGKLNVKAYASGATVPANTGVMVSAAEGGDYAVALSSATGVSVLGNDNRLRPSGHEGITAEAMEAHDANSLYYRLTMHNGTEIGYWWGAENGAAFALAANKAYLAVPKTTATKSMSMWIEDDTTMAIHTSTNENINEVLYDLTGRRIAKEQKGIHITGGRKVIR